MAEADFTSILSSKPKLKTLNKYHDLHKKWYILGAELELDDEELSKVEDEYSDDSMRTLKMFGLWLKKGENSTYRTLLMALVDIDKEDIAQLICTDLGKYSYHIILQQCSLVHDPALFYMHSRRGGLIRLCTVTAECQLCIFFSLVIYRKNSSIVSK